jgi:dihydrofolate reductase
MVSIIAAVAENGVIGGGNSLLWHISEDLRRFKAITDGHTVIMGSKTYQSLSRPLPNRTNIVITRQNIKIEGCKVVHSLEEALKLSALKEEVFIIGGAQIYEQALPFADRLYITRIAHIYKGDTYFPKWNEEEWQLVYSKKFERGENYPYPFTFEIYERERN